MDRGLSVGGVFGTAFSAFRDRAKVLVPIFLVSNLLFSAITALLGQAFVAVIVVNIASTAFIAFHTAVVMAVLRDRREDRPASSAGEILAGTLPPLPVATLAGVLATLGLIGAALLLIVPALYLLTMWAVVLPVVVVERPGVFDAFGRSRQLVRGNGWKVFGIILLLGLILVGISFPLVVLVGHQMGELARRLTGALISSFTTPFAALVVGALYYRLLDLGRPSVLE
ncbi:MAG TPA: hypothetical protein VNM38_09510 [Solirubrobacterales bacterium]|nr:hypothetical protein [Solirubrobacterales bacterium]